MENLVIINKDDANNNHGFAQEGTPLLIEGEVFIKTKGGTNIKLGLVQINITPLNDQDNIDLSAELINSHNQYKKLMLDVITLENDRLFNPDSLIEKLEDRIKNDDDTYNLFLRINKSNGWDEDKEWYENQVEKLKKTRSMLDIANNIIKNEKEKLYKTAETGMVNYTTDGDGKFITELKKGNNYLLTARASRVVFDKTEYYEWITFIDANKIGGKIILSNNNDISWPGSLNLRSFFLY